VLIVAPRHRALDQKPLNSPFLNKGGFAEKPWRTSCFFAGSASGGVAILPLSDVGSSLLRDHLSGVDVRADFKLV